MKMIYSYEVSKYKTNYQFDKNIDEVINKVQNYLTSMETVTI